MPQVVISFLDEEVLYAETPELTFELPTIEARVENVDANSERTLIPTTAIRQIMVDKVKKTPPAAVVESWDKTVFHFLDGQILHTHIEPETLLDRHDGIWHLVERNSDELRTLAMPYSALKTVFRVRIWDSRPASEQTARETDVSPHLDAVVHVLAEREARSNGQLRHKKKAPLISRMRRTAHRNKNEA